MTNENQEQPQIQYPSPKAAAVVVAASPTFMPNLRPDRKRSRPTAAVGQARDLKVIKSEPRGGERAEQTKSVQSRQRQRLQPTAMICEPRATENTVRPPVGPGPLGSQAGEQNICAACAKPIRERYLLMALDKRWHEDCLKCAGCDCRLGEVGSSLFTHADKLFCRRDFLRIFGRHGHCAACKRPIPPYEMVMRANEHAYHMDCFACQQCQYRFCVGDRYHLNEAHKIICLVCHSEQAQLREPNGAGLKTQATSTCQLQPREQTITGPQPPQIFPNTSSPPGDAGAGNLSPVDHHRLALPLQPPQESAGDTSGSEPEVIEPPAHRGQVTGNDSATQASQPPASGQDFVELTNQRAAARLTLKREPGGLDEVKGPGSSTANKKGPPGAEPTRALSAAAVTAATTAGQERACVV